MSRFPEITAVALTVQVGRLRPGVKLIEVRILLNARPFTEQRFGNAGIAPMDGYDFVVLHDNEIAQQHPPFSGSTTTTAFDEGRRRSDLTRGPP